MIMNQIRKVLSMSSSNESEKEKSTIWPKRMNWLSLLWFLFCFGGASFHTCFVTSMYLEKQLISSIEVVKPDYINVPAVSFCFPLGVIYNESSAPSNELLKSIGVACDQAKKYKSACRHKKKTITPYYDTLDDRWNASKQEEDDRIRMEDSIRSNRECFGKILAVVEATPDSNITSSLRGLIFEFFQLVETVSYLSSSDYSMVKFEPQPAFDKAFVTPLPLRGKSLGCYKLSLDAKSKKSFERHNVSKISPVFLEIEFNRDLVQNLSDIEIYVHPSNTEPLATDYRFVVNSENSYQLALETYEYSFATELFDQPCRDHGEKRRAHLVSDCIESMRRKNMSLAEKTCYEEFPNDCFLTEYKPKATKVVNGGGPLKVELLLPLNVNKITILTKTTLSEFVTMLAGIIGIWFGFSFIMARDISVPLAKALQRTADREIIQTRL